MLRGGAGRSRDDARLGSFALARSAARRLCVRAVRPVGGGAPRGAAPACGGGEDRGRAGARTGPELVPELESLVAERPLEERPRARLMLALYRAGRQADALDAFREGEAGARRRAGSRAGRAASRARARDPPPGPCAIGYGGGRAVQLDRRSIGATGRARATPSTRRSARPWSGAGAHTRADRSARGDRIRDEDARRGSSRPPCTRRRRACGSVLIFVACRGRRPAHDTPGCRPAAARDEGDPSSACSPWFSRRPLATSPPWSSGAGTGRPDRRPLWRVRARLGGARAGCAGPPPCWIGPRLIGAADGRPGDRDASRLLADASLIVQHTTGSSPSPCSAVPGGGVSSSPREQGSSFSGCPSAGAQKGSGGLDLPSWPRLHPPCSYGVDSDRAGSRPRPR